MQPGHAWLIGQSKNRNYLRWNLLFITNAKFRKQKKLSFYFVENNINTRLVEGFYFNVLRLIFFPSLNR